MCGIIGYVGQQQATPILLDGLRRLEYRGYDSAGIAVLAEDGTLVVRKREGKLANLVALLAEGEPVRGTLGVGHTRWATHGAPNDANAHPHADCEGRIIVVHNGIIENYQPLRERLLARGHAFQSQTDTEVIVHLIEDEYRALNNGQKIEEGARALRNGRRADFSEAVRRALLQVRGAYAIVALCRDEPELLVGARRHAPLMVGLGERENYVGSDIAAMLAHTRSMLALEDGDVASLRPSGVAIRTLEGNCVERLPFQVAWNAESAGKGGYPHFVLKEIYEQPQALAQALVGRLTADGVSLPELAPLDLARVARIVLVGCGSAYYAAMIGKYYIEQWARIPVELSVASEFRYAQPVLDRSSLCVFVSQSGETADTLASFRLAQEAGAQSIALTNTQGSSLARGADAVVYLQTGPEIGVVATKTFTAQVALLALMAMHLATERGRAGADEIEPVLTALRSVPRQMEELLRSNDGVKEVAGRYAGVRSMFFLGRHVGYPLALEGALKLKEISYIHAEGYAAGELKHGPIAMLDRELPVVALATAGKTYDKVISNIQETRARGARVLAIATEGDEQIRAHCDDVIFVPPTHEMLAPLLAVLPLQLFAYHIAVALGRDVDQPRNLAKSVTVE
jgi:glutamine---fructose-6-phosphate transaminase (isomerizing)